MNAIDTLTNVAGLYALTAEGELGRYDAAKAFTVDRDLSQAFGPQIRQLLRSHLAAPSADTFRLGVVYHAGEERPWNSDTLLLEESVVREVYPVGGPAGQELTAFQKKNREKSIFRGMELLLDYRLDQLSDSPVYCPVLFDRGTVLDDYAGSFGLVTETGAEMPVAELLNLLAVIPHGRRKTPELAELLGHMHRYIERKGGRLDTQFTIRQERYVASGAGVGEAEFFDVDKRHERQQAWTEDMLQRRLSAAESARRTDQFDQVEQWLERPHRPVDSALLRTFVQFRGLDESRLAMLAEQALVYTAPSAAKLLNLGMKDAWNMYLLEGTVSLVAADGGSLFVTGGTATSASPISFLKPRKYAVTAVTSVSFLWIHDAVLGAVLIPPGPPPAAASALKPSGL